MKLVAALPLLDLDSFDDILNRKESVVGLKCVGRNEARIHTTWTFLLTWSPPLVRMGMKKRENKEHAWAFCRKIALRF